MTNIEWTSKAMELLESLEPDTQERIVNKLGEASEWTDHRLESLSGYPYYKLRVGDYRVIVSWDRNADRLTVEAVGHRRNVYERHLPP